MRFKRFVRFEVCEKQYNVKFEGYVRYDGNVKFEGYMICIGYVEIEGG